MKTLNWPIVTFFVVSSLLVTQCTPSTPSPAKVPTTEEMEVPPSTQEALTEEVEVPPSTEEAMKEEKTLIIATPALAVSLDPCYSLTLTTAEVQENVYAFWLIPELVEGPGGVPIENTAAGEAAMKPEAVESWEVLEDGTVYRLHLRKDIIDSFGNQLKAEDAKWLFDRTRSLDACSWLMDGLSITEEDQVKVLDDYTLEITLPGPNPIFLRVLYVMNHSALGAATARQHATDSDPWAEEWLKRNAPATGPYMVEEWAAGEEMVLVRNPNWFGAPPAIDKIVYRQVPEAANRVALVIAGEADIAREIDQGQLDRIDQSGEADAVCVAGNVFVYMGLNTEKGPTADAAVRRALAYAVPYQDILDSAYRGRAEPLWSFITADTPNVVPAEDNPYELDLEKARELLTEAGYPDGFPFSVLVNNSIPEHERMAVLIKDSFSKIGVDLQIDKKPVAAFTDKAFARDLESVIHQDYSIVLDATYQTFLWLDDGPPPNVNFVGYTDPEFSQLMVETITMEEGPERAEKQKRMQELVINDSPWLFLANAPTCYGMQKTVAGYTWHLSNQMHFRYMDISQ